MLGLKELRHRKKNAQTISRITGAMKMVARSKFNRAKAQLTQAVSICEELKELAGRILAEKENIQNFKDPTYIRENPKNLPSILIVATSDSGLCGNFNQKLAKPIQNFVDEKIKLRQEVDLICVGKKGIPILQKIKSTKVINVFVNVNDQLFPIIDLVTTLFRERRISVCSLIYNRFYNVIKQEPYIVQLLPMVIKPKHEGALINDRLFSYEPSTAEVLEEICNLLFSTSLHAFIKEHTFSEQAARMAAMDSATENATELLEELKLRYNHLRQALITNELIEIIAGAEALNKT